MIQITTGKGTFGLAEVPEEYKNFEIKKYSHAGTWLMESDSKSLNHWKVNLHANNYTFLFCTKTATEEDAKGVVEQVSGWDNAIYYDYTAKGRDYRDIVEAAFKSPLNSLTSLLKSNNIDTAYNWAVLKIKQDGE